jgi:adenylate cyclase
MMAINSQDERTLMGSGMVRVTRGEYEGGLAYLRRAHEINPNFAGTVIALAFAEATMGQAGEAKTHAQLALRLSPRDNFIGTAHLALAMANFTLRDYDEAAPREYEVVSEIGRMGGAQRYSSSHRQY